MDVGTVIGIIGVLVSFLGIPIAFVVARRSRQLPDLRYVIDFDVLLNPDDRVFGRGLYMSIGDHPINSISRSRVAFWNHRGDTIRGQDIVDSDPLRLQFASGDIALQVRTLSMSRLQTKLVATRNPKDGRVVDIGFDFLDAADGFIFEIIHIGPERPTLSGTVRGAKLKNSGSAHLNSQALVSYQKPVWRSFVENIPLRAQINVLGNIFAGIVAAVAVIVIAVASSVPPHLINVKNYNLKTIAGQGAFANNIDVLATNSRISIVLEVTFSLFAVYCFWQIKRSFSRCKFPTTILDVSTDDNSQSSNLSNSSASESEADETKPDSSVG